MDANAMQSMSSQFGIINSLRTGNVVFDMLICMMIPVFFKVLTVVFEKFQPAFQAFLDNLRNNKNVVVKTLDYEFRMNAWGSVQRAGKEERNNILQKALTLFIAEIKDLKLETSKISFMAVKEKGKRDNDSYEMVYGGTAEQLAMYSINTLPPNAVWIELRKGLQFRQSVIEPNNEGENKITKMTIRFEFKGDNPDGEKKINEFVQEAFDWYVEKMKSLADHSRYLYMLVKSPPSASSEDSGGGDDAPTRVYKRYKLSDEKSFTCLFFREKQMLLKLLSHFKEKTGKYAIQGFPHKLGLLLHGPPGTGKTSLIKAMAQHTGRNVVSVPLARIETNQELMDIVFDQSFAVKGEDMPIKLSFKDIIFVMEDVDAASPIVHSRSGDKSGDSTTKVILEKAGGDHGPEKVELTKQVSNSAAETSSAGVGGDMESRDKEGDKDQGKDHKAEGGQSDTKDEGEKGNAQKTTEESDTAEGEKKKDAVDGDADDADETAATDGAGAGEDGSPKVTAAVEAVKAVAGSSSGVKTATSSKYMSKYDKLDLSGLLNVLDGVVDCPNRILIMTTNHPEKLDPALIRPGRIDKIIYLGYLQAPEALEMIEHYFGVEMSVPQWHRLENALDTADLTPAEVEQLCAEYDEVDEFLTALEERVLDECEKNMQKTQLHTSASTLSRHDDMPPPAPLKRGLSTTSKVSNVSTSSKTSENPIVSKALRAASACN